MLPTITNLPENDITVLVLDDDPHLRALMVYQVKKTGFKTLEADTVKGALHILETEPINLVLTDVMLPDGNGVELTRMIKTAYPLIEVIAITSEGRISDGVQAIKNGAYDYLEKGSDNHRLPLLLTGAAEKHLLQSQLKQLDEKVDDLNKEANRKDLIAENMKQLEKASLILKALQSPLRQRILHLMFTRGQVTVTEVYTELELDQPIASQHLAILKNAGLVEHTREGKSVHYSANYSGIEKIVAVVQQLMPKG